MNPFQNLIYNPSLSRRKMRAVNDHSHSFGMGGLTLPGMVMLDFLPAYAFHDLCARLIHSSIPPFPAVLVRISTTKKGAATPYDRKATR